MLHGNFHKNSVSFTLAVNDVLIKSRFTAVQIRDKLLNTTLIMEFFFR